MSQPKFTISGLRGVWEETLTENLARTYIEAYSLFLQTNGAKKIILGRDSRKSGPIINKIAIDILTARGFQVIDAGIIPTPTLIYLLRTTPFDGGIMITASHNPPEYNGIKFLSKDAFYLNQREIDEVKNFVGMPSHLKEGGTVAEDFSLGEKHIEHISKNVDSQLIRDQKFKVVLDPINGAGYKLGPLLLRKLGCEVTVINDKPDGNFGHMPEPLPENLGDLSTAVKDTGADIGFALDPDADRLVVCDEKGEVVFEEYTLTLAIKSVLKKTPGDIVTNLSTTNTNEDLANEAGFKNYRSKVGEANVVDGIIKHNAIIGGEGGGGVIYPRINLCRDGLVGMALILESLALEKKTVSGIVSELPHYEFIKTKMPFSGDFNKLLHDLEKTFKEEKIDLQDGIRIDFSDSSWLQMRSSNTEPIIRIYAEAKTKEAAERLIEKARECIARS
jgi:phosphomannomutase